jgi:hypothetical protein
MIVEVNWRDVLTQVGSTTVIVVCLGWLAKALFGHTLSRDIETYKSKLKGEADTYKSRLKSEVGKQLARIDREAKSALQEQQACFNHQMVDFQSGVTARAASAERVRQEIERWANPILDAANSLQSRLNDILKNQGYLNLSPKTKESSAKRSFDYNYFMPSTVFLFC